MNNSTNLQLNTLAVSAEHRRMLKENVAVLKDNEVTLRKSFELLAAQYLAPFARSIHDHNQTVLLMRERLTMFGFEQDCDGNRISLDEVSASLIEPLPTLYQLLDRAVNSPLQNSPQLSSEDE